MQIIDVTNQNSNSLVTISNTTQAEAVRDNLATFGDTASEAVTPKKPWWAECRVRGKKMFRVRWQKDGRTVNKYFSGKEAAVAHVAKLNGEQIGANQFWAGLTGEQRDRIVTAWREADRRGVDLLSLAVNGDDKRSKAAPALEEVLNEIVLAKRKANLSDRYAGSGTDATKTGKINHILRPFCAGRERLPIDKVSLADVESFLDRHKIESRSTVRASLSTLFRFAVRRRYMPSNPCDQLEPVRITRKTPRVFTPQELAKALKWLKQNPKLLGWFVLSTFCGLRPEEAQQSTWAAVNFTEGCVTVEAQTSKKRQRRVVYPLAQAMKCLRVAQDAGAVLPLNDTAMKRGRLALRAAIGLETWPKDVTRHTAASMWIAISENPESVAHHLGNSPKVLLRDYKALVTKSDAKRFWATGLS